MLMPQSLGGAETSTATYAESLARIAAECGATSTVYMTQMHCAHPIHLQAIAEQIETWIPRLCDATAVGAIALTEPSAGSDVSDDAHAGPSGRRRVRHQRREDVHLERRPC